jgi:integrase
MTGARRGEIAEMRWREVNFDTGVWTLPAERSKNGEAHALPLPDAALDILRGLEKFEWSDLVFSNDGGRTRVRSFNGVSKRLAARMKLAEEWTLHDLRRSAASGMADVDVAPHIIEAVIGHKSGVIKGIARVYNRHTYDREQLAALTKWAERLEKIKSGQETKKVVVLMRR